MAIVRWSADQFYGYVEGAQQLFATPFFRTIFENRCYIAGGFIRNLLRHRTILCIDKFWKRQSDLDIFAPSYEAIAKLSFSAGFNGQFWNASMNKNAYEAFIAPPVDLPMRGGKMQIVICAVAPPDEMISGFDFLNCQAAFDGKTLYMHDRLLELEDEKVLESSIASKFYAHRIRKYLYRHDYKDIGPVCKQLVLGWLDERKKNNDWPELGGTAAPHRLRDLLTTDELSRFLGIAFQNTKVIDTYGEALFSEIDLVRLDLHQRKLRQFNEGDLVSIPELVFPSGVKVNHVVLGVKVSEQKRMIFLPDGRKLSMRENFFYDVISKGA